MTDWEKHLLEVILPWWEQRAIDDERGGVRTGFDNDGELHTTDRFTWSQGRWAWLAGELADEARAGRLAVDADTWTRRCLQTCERMASDAIRPDGRTHFRVTETGEPVADATGETATSVFADLFLVLGLSAGLRQLPADDPRGRAWLGHGVRILQAAECAIGDRTALSEPYPVPPGYGDLAGPMTLVHTAAELLRTPAAPERADEIRGVRGRAGHHIATQVIAGEDWWEMRPDDDNRADTLLARHRTPGHMLELLWMLDHATDDDPTFRPVPTEQLHAIAGGAIERGWDPDHGGVLRYVDRLGGEPHGRLLGDARYEELVRDTWSTKLWWVHVEAMYALTRFGSQGNARLAAWAERVAAYTLATFPDPDGREWLHIRARDGSPFNEVVALPVKDPFHIIRALTLLNRLTTTGPDPSQEGDQDHA